MKVGEQRQELKRRQIDRIRNQKSPAWNMERIIAGSEDSGKKNEKCAAILGLFAVIGGTLTR